MKTLDPIGELIKTYSEVFDRGLKSFRDALLQHNPALIFPELYGEEKPEFTLEEICWELRWTETDVRNALNDFNLLNGDSTIPRYKGIILMTRRSIEDMFGEEGPSLVDPVKVVGYSEKISNLSFIDNPEVAIALYDDLKESYNLTQEIMQEYSRAGLIEPIIAFKEGWVLNKNDFERLVSGKVAQDYEKMKEHTDSGVYNPSDLPQDAIKIPAVLGGRIATAADNKRVVLPTAFRKYFPVEEDGSRICGIIYDEKNQRAYVIPSNIIPFINQTCMTERIDPQHRFYLGKLFPDAKELNFQGGDYFLTVSPIHNNPRE